MSQIQLDWSLGADTIGVTLWGSLPKESSQMSQLQEGQGLI